MTGAGRKEKAREVLLGLTQRHQGKYMVIILTTVLEVFQVKAVLGVLSGAPLHGCCSQAFCHPLNPGSGECPTLSYGRGRFRVITSPCSCFLRQATSNSNIPLRGELSGYPAQPSPARSRSDPILSLTPVEFRSCGVRKTSSASILDPRVTSS